MKNNSNVTYQMLKVSDLKIAKYQRAPQFSRVKQYSANFKPSLVGTLIVSQRDGQYWVVDGQHRVLLLKSKEIHYVMCEIHTGLTYEEESLMFIDRNRSRKGVSTIDCELALIEATDENAMLICEILGKHKYIYGRGKSRNSISAIATIKNIYKVMGIDIIDKCLFLIRQCWDGDSQSTDAEMLMGVSLFIKNNPNFNEKNFIKKLSNIEPKVIIREGKSDISHTGKSIAGYRRFESVITKYYEKGNRKKSQTV
jgi:hypothetical protein